MLTVLFAIAIKIEYQDASFCSTTQTFIYALYHMS